MYLQLPFRLGAIWAGRDYDTEMDVRVGGGLLRRKGAQQGDRAHRINFHFAWDWLPVRVYRDIVDQSSAWTGRDRVFVGFAGWRRSFGITRIRGPRKNT